MSILGSGHPGRLADLLYPKPVKPRVFISYHHRLDQFHYDLLSWYYTDQNDLFQDASLEERVDSDDSDYVRWSIRDNCIRGSSCTVVLCGAETPERKHVDWEIKATLDMEHGLVGICLPTAQRDHFGNVIVPPRLHDNIQSAYAGWMDWNALTASTFAAAVNAARGRAAACKYLIRNWRDLKSRNG